VVNRIIRPQVDHERNFVLFGDCCGKIGVTGHMEIATKPDVIVGGHYDSMVIKI
jgi:hypothetical protein